MVHSFGSDAAAALLSSSFYTVAFFPLHRVKILLQTQNGSPEVQSGKITRYTFASSFPRLIKENGIRSLWRGCLPYMLRHVPSTTLSFAIKDAIGRAMPAYDPATQQREYALSRIAAGGAAGVIALAIVYPLDLTTIRMAAHLGPKDPSMLETIQGSTRRGGLMALYRGFGVSALAIGGYKALYFGLYDTAKVYLLSPGPPHTTSATHTQHTDASTSQTQPTQAATQPQNQQEQQQQQQQGSQGFAGGSGDKGSLTGAAVPAHTVLAPSPADPGAALDGPAGPLAWHPVWTQPHTQVLQGLARAFTAYTHEVPVRTQAETPMQGTNAHGTYNTSSRPITPLTEGLQGSIRSSRPIQKGAQIQQDVAPHGPGPRPQPAQPAVPAAPSHHGLSHLLYAWAVASGVVFLASSVTYPLDVVRKRWVVDAGLANHKYKSAWDCAMGIVRQEGMPGLYRFYHVDMMLRMGGGLLLVLYDEVRTAMWQVLNNRQKPSVTAAR